MLTDTEGLKKIYGFEEKGKQVLLNLNQAWRSLNPVCGTEAEETKEFQEKEFQEAMATQIEDIKYFIDIEFPPCISFDPEKERAEELLEKYVKFPASYNRTMILGALQYSILALRKTSSINLSDSKKKELKSYVYEYLDDVSSLLSDNADNLIDLNLENTEDKLKKIEIFCSKLGILPKLDEEILDLGSFS